MKEIDSLYENELTRNERTLAEIAEILLERIVSLEKTIDTKQTRRKNMGIKHSKEYYKVSFVDWLAKNHPEADLLDWQIEIINILIDQPMAAGKTYLIKLLSEYDRDAS